MATKKKLKLESDPNRVVLVHFSHPDGFNDFTIVSASQAEAKMRKLKLDGMQDIKCPMLE